MAEEKNAKEKVEIAKVGTSAAATVARIVADPTGVAAALALFSFVPAAVGFCLPKVFERKKAEAQSWWDDVVMANAPDESVRIEIERRLKEEPAVQDVIAAGYKAILEMIAPESRLPLAALTREYCRSGKAPDRFFRGTCTVLTQLSSDEYRSFERLVKALHSFGLRGQSFEMHLNVPSDENGVLLEQGSPEFVRQGGGGEWVDVSGPNAPALFGLLRESGLAFGRPVGRIGLSDNHILMIGRPLIERIVNLLG